MNVEEMTKVYLQSYMTALNETKNSTLAAQTATAVLMVVSTAPKQNPMNSIITMMMQANEQAKKQWKPKGKDGGKDETN